MGRIQNAKVTSSELRQNDYELLYYLLQSEEMAWKQLQTNYLRYVEVLLHQYYYRFNEDEKQELRQECLESLAIAASEYREDQGASFFTYVAKRFDNIFMSKMRHNASQKQQLVKHMRSLDITVNDKETSYLIDFVRNDQWEFEGKLKLQWKEHQRLEQKRLSDLNDLEKRIYEYQKLGYRYNEIAKILNISRKKVDNTMQKIRKKLGIR